MAIVGIELLLESPLDVTNVPALFELAYSKFMKEIHLGWVGRIV